MSISLIPARSIIVLRGDEVALDEAQEGVVVASMVSV
jgi:hypothetical protein